MNTTVSEDEKKSILSHEVISNRLSPDGETPPRFIVPLKNLVVKRGDSVDLEVEIQGSQPVRTLWIKEDDEIPLNSKEYQTLSLGNGRFALRIHCVEETAIYIFEAYNLAGDVDCWCRVLVIDGEVPTLKPLPLVQPPFFTAFPSVLEIEEGGRLQLTTVYSGLPAPEIQWEIGGIDAKQNFTRNRVTTTENRSSLEVHPVSTDDDGLITCRARNRCGSATVSTRVIVYPTTNGVEKICSSLYGRRSLEKTASIVKGPVDVFATRGSEVLLEALFVGKPEPSVVWLKGNEVLETCERISTSVKDGCAILRLSDVTDADCGKYIIVVANCHGSDCHFASVNIQGPPDPPRDAPNIDEITNGGATLSWYGSIYDGGSAVTGYVVEYRTEGDLYWSILRRCHSTSCVVTDLTHGGWYQFRVRATNVHGSSHPGPETDSVCLKVGPIQRRVSTYSSVSDEGELEQPFPYQIVEVEDGQLFSQRYSVHEEMGKGRFGVVYRAMNRVLCQPRAAKFVRCLKASDREKVRKEVEVMNLLRHPKLLQMESAFELPKEIVIVTELITGGELFERVVADDFTLTEKDCILFMRQICEGVQYMHGQSVVHLDLKPENILCVTRTSHSIKLIDFGLARQLNNSEPLRVMFGTPEFISPEIVSYEPVSFSADMWALGVVCYVLLSGLSPFMGESDADTFSNITRGDFDFNDESFDAISQEAKDFISALLVMKPECRMTASDCLQHKWLAQSPHKMKSTKISTDKLKKFIIRRKWQKTGTAIRAIGRMATMSSRRNSSASSRRTSRLDSLSDDLDMTALSQLASLQLSGSKASSISSRSSRNNTSSTYSERSDSGFSDVHVTIPLLRHQESIVEECVANGELVCDTESGNVEKLKPVTSAVPRSTCH